MCILHISNMLEQRAVSRVDPELASTMEHYVSVRWQMEASWSASCCHSGCVQLWVFLSVLSGWFL